jgi:hypothetical protein
MRKIARAAVTGALALPLVLGAAGIAAADSGPVFGQFMSTADASGASSTGVVSGFLGSDATAAADGSAMGSPAYMAWNHTANASGAVSTTVSSAVDAEGNTYYIVHQLGADQNGVTSSMTYSRS